MTLDNRISLEVFITVKSASIRLLWGQKQSCFHKEKHPKSIAGNVCKSQTSYSFLHSGVTIGHLLFHCGCCGFGVSSAFSLLNVCPADFVHPGRDKSLLLASAVTQSGLRMAGGRKATSAQVKCSRCSWRELFNMAAVFLMTPDHGSDSEAGDSDAQGNESSWMDVRAVFTHTHTHIAASAFHYYSMLPGKHREETSSSSLENRLFSRNCECLRVQKHVFPVIVLCFSKMFFFGIYKQLFARPSHKGRKYIKCYIYTTS